MKCFTEELLALYVEGDLPPTGGAVYDRALFHKSGQYSQTDAVEIERHIETCAACAAAVEKLRASQALFKSLREDRVTPEALATVRGHVFEKIEREKVSSRWLNLERLLFVGIRRYALASVAVAVVATGLVWYSRPVLQPDREPVQTAMVTPTANNNVAVDIERESQPSAPRRPLRRVRHHSPPSPDANPTTPSAEEPQQIVMKIVTDDPNVVIYWLFDQKGADE